MMKLFYFVSFILIHNIIAVPSVFFGQNTPPPKTPNIQGPAFVSEKIPILDSSVENAFEQLKNTIWVTLDLRNNRELYVFFQEGKYGNSAVPRGTGMKYPNRFYPMKYVQAGNSPNSGIFVVASQEKLLYYSFYFFTPYYLVISGGYNNIESLLSLETEDSLTDGYMMQLIY